MISDELARIFQLEHNPDGSHKHYSIRKEYIETRTEYAYAFTLDDIPDGSVYGRVKLSSLTTGEVTKVTDASGDDLTIALSGADRLLTVEADSKVNQDLTNDAAVTFGFVTALSYLRSLEYRLQQESYSDLFIQNKSNNSGYRILEIDVNNVNRTLNITGSPVTLANWFDQSVKQAATPTFGNVTVTTGFTIGYNTLDTNEWAFLDGQDQAVKKASTPEFVGLTVKGNLDMDDAAHDLLIPDNNAAALEIKEGANAYVTFDTTDGATEEESGIIKIHKTLRASGAVVQAAQGFSRVDIGVQANTPRLVFEGQGSTVWLVDNDWGAFRWYIPNYLKLKLDSSTFHLWGVDALLRLTKKLYFRDTGIYMYSPTDGHLEIKSDGGVDGIKATSPVEIEAAVGSQLLTLDQNEHTGWFVEFEGESAADDSYPISSAAEGTLNYAKAIKIKIGGVMYFLKAYTYVAP